MGGDESRDFDLVPGDRIERKRLHERLGGRTQGGIGPSSRTPNVFIFTDPIAGQKHGYFDGPMSDGAFHYTGEGQYGDQRMVSGNASILNHRKDGRKLRLFMGARGTVTYLGEFEVDPDHPWYETDAPETGDGPIRKVIVFRLRAIDAVEVPLSQGGLAQMLGVEETLWPTVLEVDVEQYVTEKTFVNPNQEPHEAERKEAELVDSFANHLRRAGYIVTRQRITPSGEVKPLFTDLCVPALNLLVEAKGSVTRENVRMAIGQLMDYGRFFPRMKRAVLLPSEPRKDLADLLESAGVFVIWRESSKFISNDAALSIS
jgi:hypothetical protein